MKPALWRRLQGPNAGTYLVTWNGHADALGLWRIDAATGALTLANSYTYATWGVPTVTTHSGYPDLGFRFLYAGQHDVQWDNLNGLGIYYMHARHYAPTLGRFLQPDPTRRTRRSTHHPTPNVRTSQAISAPAMSAASSGIEVPIQGIVTLTGVVR